jgi:hypothetical protein
MVKRSFYQDRLGTNIQGNPLKTEWRFLRYGQWNEQQHLVTYLGKKTALFEPFIYKMHYITKTGSGQT